ncbi:LptA/OstA family protein [Pseudogemmobacter sonorensis]|uniref:LptA/OstA family protein n=1 Tax=Pseudogemmobacter sonorensis TaxID=2989681 RepID=UPI0036A2EA58
MRPPLSALSLGLLLALVPAWGASAQQAEVSFGGLEQDTSQPVTIDSDSLSLNNADGTALFSGNVLVVQGDLRLSAGEIRVEYAEDRSGIERLHASGGVLIVSLSDAAQSREAVYTIASGQVVMTGDVLLTQGATAIAGQTLRLDLKSGTGVVEGRVSTTFVPGGN